MAIYVIILLSPNGRRGKRPQELQMDDDDVFSQVGSTGDGRIDGTDKLFPENAKQNDNNDGDLGEEIVHYNEEENNGEYEEDDTSAEIGKLVAAGKFFKNNSPNANVPMDETLLRNKPPAALPQAKEPPIKFKPPAALEAPQAPQANLVDNQNRISEDLEKDDPQGDDSGTGDEADLDLPLVIDEKKQMELNVADAKQKFKDDLSDTADVSAEKPDKIAQGAVNAGQTGATRKQGALEIPELTKGHVHANGGGIIITDKLVQQKSEDVKKGAVTELNDPAVANRAKDGIRASNGSGKIAAAVAPEKKAEAKVIVADEARLAGQIDAATDEDEDDDTEEEADPQASKDKWIAEAKQAVANELEQDKAVIKAELPEKAQKDAVPDVPPAADKEYDNLDEADTVDNSNAASEADSDGDLQDQLLNRMSGDDSAPSNEKPKPVVKAIAAPAAEVPLVDKEIRPDAEGQRPNLAGVVAKQGLGRNDSRKRVQAVYPEENQDNAPDADDTL
ncbi:hypothetical protein HDU96_005362 [Phlyctochytrium bullatum]|nr:hypothetical protein HDU96_005362 [Phlyctochytrium bullatum]